VPDFASFDARGYRTVGPRAGYAEWAPTYEATVVDAMDLELLAELRSVGWTGAAADLGCGTGRTGAWMRSRGVEAIDGVDVTPEMLQVAKARHVYRRLVESDVLASALASGSYDLVVASLVDDHLPALAPLHAEAARLLRPGGAFVTASFHPHFVMATGMPTHFENAAGEPVAIDTHIHLLSEHFAAGSDAGLTLAELSERLVDDAWIALKPAWERWRDHPVSLATVWRRPG
jgi:SAM-dependent methyltransferase